MSGTIVGVFVRTGGVGVSDDNPHADGNLSELVEDLAAEPRMYQVVLHNDDYTTVDFVVEVLVVVFRRTVEDATLIMLDVHHRGRGVVGTYTYDIATTKANAVQEMAREREFPLRCTVEPA
jgi:ATP-dependent Clp protease adaptor protein ClpS